MKRAERRAAPKPARIPGAVVADPCVVLGDRPPYPAGEGSS